MSRLIGDLIDDLLKVAINRPNRSDFEDMGNYSNSEPNVS